MTQNTQPQPQLQSKLHGDRMRLAQQTAIPSKACNKSTKKYRVSAHYFENDLGRINRCEVQSVLVSHNCTMCSSCSLARYRILDNPKTLQDASQHCSKLL